MKHFLLILSVLFSSQLFSQNGNMCGASEMLRKTLEQNPELARAMEQGEEFAKKYAKSYKKNKANETYVIPVVFHVYYGNDEENVPKKQLENVINALNEDFQLKHANVDQISASFIDIAASVNIEFRLAQIDPEGKCTDGITRTATSTSSTNSSIDYSSTWDPHKYLNIWLVGDLVGRIAYATFPPGGHAIDGIVAEYWIPSSSRIAAFAHEAGHYLGLPHTWGNSDDVALPSNCDTDDGIEDTPNTIGTQGCNVNHESCGSLDNEQNFMNYSTCLLMFTEGQKTKMYATLNTPGSPRNNLWQESNLIATGTNDGYIAQECAPKLDFIASKELTCPDNTIEFSGQFYNSDTIENWNWSFPGGTPSSSTLQNPTVVYENGGQYDVTLSADNNAGSTSITKENYLTVLGDNYSEQLPFFEGMESTLFPQLAADTLKEWGVEGNWRRDTNGVASGKASLRFVQAAGILGTRSLSSPSFSLFDRENVQLTFKMAFAVMQENLFPMELRIYVSKDCGEKWSEIYTKSKADLYTNGGELPSGFFVPNSSEWREEVVSLEEFKNEPAVLIMFELKGSSGGVFYIDDININEDMSTGINNMDNAFISLNIFPNPVNKSSIIEMTLDKPTEVSLELKDILGNSVRKSWLGKINGTHQSDFLQDLNDISEGLYLLQVTADDKKIVRKIVF